MREKKVGIITFHDADNLGAVLQAYALEQTLEQACNVSAEIIDYRCETITATRKVEKAKFGKESIKAFAKRCYYRIKRRGFEKFRKKRLKLSAKTYHKETVAECSADYDIFLCGSDQVWNLECSGQDTVYFLDFVPESKKKISYAASLGSYTYKEEEREGIRNLLDRFDAISVREKSGKAELERLGINNVLVHVDPVILLSQAQWRAVMTKRLCKRKYILVYLVVEDVNVTRCATEYANKHGYKVINNKKSIEFILHNSPAEFLSWIFYAERVFTNSFHGTAFSLLFNKPLGADMALKNGGTNNRVKEILESTGSESCILLDNNREGSIGNAEKAFEEKRNDAIAYLKGLCG